MWLIFLMIFILFILLHIHAAGEKQFQEYSRAEIKDMIERHGWNGTIDKIAQSFIPPHPRNSISAGNIRNLFVHFVKTGEGDELLVSYWSECESFPNPREAVEKTLRKYGKFYAELIYKISGENPEKYNVFKDISVVDYSCRPAVMVAAIACGCEYFGFDHPEMKKFYEEISPVKAGKKIAVVVFPDIPEKMKIRESDVYVFGYSAGEFQQDPEKKYRIF